MSGDAGPRGSPAITGVPLSLRGTGGRATGRFLSQWRLPPAAARRDGLARLAGWSKDAGCCALVLEERACSLTPDFRALGFDDAGPLPRYSAPARPGRLRWVLTWLLMPGARDPGDLSVVPAALPDAEEQALRARLAPDFGAVTGWSGEMAAPEAGLHLLRDGRPVASCRFAPAVSAAGELAVPHWIAPPGEPEVTALLASSVLDVADARAAVVFETPHRGLARGLLLARLLPRPSRARILVRRQGGRDLPAPAVSDWHLSAATVLRSP